VDLHIPDKVVFRLHDKQVRDSIAYCGEYLLCFRHAVEAAMQGQDVDVILEEEEYYRSCDRCGGKEAEDMRK